jgi:hypothetical protein
MGLTSRLSYKSWDFSFSLRASLNNYVYNSVEAGGSDCNPTSVYSFGALNNRPLMGVANNIQSKNDNTLLSDYFVQNASFMKCDNSLWDTRSKSCSALRLADAYMQPYRTYSLSPNTKDLTLK